MALIENSEIKESSGGYYRLFGIEELGKLISRVHSTSISSGSELERLILSQVKKIDDLDRFLECEDMPDGILIASKKAIKKSKIIKFEKSEPDFMIFHHRENKKHCYVVELKDGHVFDTKKAAGEKESIDNFIKENGKNLPYRMSCHFCCFNQNDKDSIIRGFKQKITKDEAMTGREFCRLLEIDYDEIVKQRESDREPNIHFFLLELVKIKGIRNRLEKLLSEGNS